METLQDQGREPHTELEREIVELAPWFHNLHLPGGVQTAPGHPLGDYPRYKWQAIAPHLPEVLSGWSVLDVGCNAGFYSFELARRGARVTAVDSDERYLRQASWAASRLRIDGAVEFRRLQVYELGGLKASYDLVLFLGVFYHLRYPLLGLDIVRSKTRRLLVFQSLTAPDASPAETPENLGFEERGRLFEPGWPKFGFVQHRLAGDPTNWFIPNVAAVKAALRTAGFRTLAQPLEDTFVCAPDERLRDPLAQREVDAVLTRLNR